MSCRECRMSWFVAVTALCGGGVVVVSLLRSMWCVLECAEWLVSGENGVVMYYAP